MTAPESKAGVALEPCPFCGGEARMENDQVWAWGVCRECNAEGPTHTSKSLAIAAWNRRAAPRTSDSTGEVLTDGAQITENIRRRFGHDMRHDAGRAFFDAIILEIAADLRDMTPAALKAALAALPPSSGWEAGAEASPKLAYALASGDTLAAMRKALLASPLYQQGDARLAWVNEGDFLMLSLAGVRVVDLTKPLPPPPPSKEGV